MAKGEIFVIQGKTNQSGPQTARAATKAVSNWWWWDDGRGMVVVEDIPEGLRG